MKSKSPLDFFIIYFALKTCKKINLKYIVAGFMVYYSSNIFTTLVPNTLETDVVVVVIILRGVIIAYKMKISFYFLEAVSRD